MASLRDVAKLANVNVSTVSRYLAGTLNVKAETELKILRAIESLNYSPNNIARALRTRKSQTIGVITPSGSNTLFAGMVEGIHYELTSNKYALVQIPTENDPLRELSAIETLTARQVDGFIVFNTSLTYKQWFAFKANRKTPFVFVNCMYNHPSFYRVLTEFRNGSYEATRFLLSLGRHRIAMITGRPGQDESEEKLRGYCDALHEAGISVDKSLVRPGFYSFDKGMEVAQYFLAEQNPDAIFASNDLMAIAAMKSAQACGLEIPKDISIIGYGNSEASLFTNPELTTIDQQKKDTGKHAAAMLLKVLRGERPKTKYLSTSLVIHQSA